MTECPYTQNGAPSAPLYNAFLPLVVGKDADSASSAADMAGANAEAEPRGDGEPGPDLSDDSQLTIKILQKQDELPHDHRIAHPMLSVHVIDGRAFIENRTVDDDGYLVTQAVDADDFLLRRSQYYRQQQQEEEAKMQQQQQQEQSQKQPQLQHQFQQQSQHQQQQQQQQLLAQNASVSENGPITVNNINSAGLDRS